MKYEFHVGDYVETKDGRVGYIDFCSSGSYDICLNPIEKNEYSHSSKMLLMPEITDEKLAEDFVRIGQYDFTKKDKIEYLPKYYVESLAFGDLSKKINELVETVNELKTDYEKHLDT